ncbi:MAG: sulfatase-like hydrolase/transferase, partial [Elusimicrobia bacterium]|nr:sulfatase-like hydrolase/transferase [Elusimicrobiota bacterium]
YSHLSRPTRLAGVVLGFALLAAAVGVRGVLRFHAPKNEGPNILVIGVDSLRSDMLKISRGGGALTPNMNELVQSGRTYSYCIPPLADTAGPLMTLFTGRTPLTHGIRHSFSPGQDLSLGPTSLPALLKRRGYTTRVLTDFAGDFFSHLTKEFDQVQSADFHAVRQRRLQVLLRQVHVLPYLSGIWGRRFFPSLRNSLGLSDPSLLAEEAVPALRALRAREKFFFMVYFSALHDPYAAHSLDLYRDMGEYDGPCKYAMPLSRKRRSSLSPMDRVRARRLYEANVRAVDDAVGRILSALKRNRLADNTLVVLWSNHGEHLFEMGLGQGHGKHLKGMDVLAAPLVINEPRQRSAPKWVTEPVRTQDIAPTLLSLVGIPVPEDMEGFPLHQRDFSLPADEFFAAYSETGLWPSTDDGPGIPAERIPYPEVEEILEFDETEGRFRIGSRWEDHVLLAKHRMVQLGGERLVYIPTRQGVVYEYFNSGVDPAGIRNLAETADGAIRVKELKEVLFRALSREPGWRPQNGYWIPEAFWREE